MISILASIALAAHPGGLDSEGCHRNRQTGERHCHRAPARPPAPPQALQSGTSFRNCSEARAAGRSNIRRGERGYGAHLDRDGDGVACER